MARDVIILMRALSITKAIGRVGPEIETFWALEWQEEKRVPLGLSDAFTTRLDFIHTRLDLIGMESIFFMKPLC
jgi:hypothetical protein